MKNALLGALLLAALAVAGFIGGLMAGDGSTVAAQDTGVWEYGYFIPVPRVESYKLDIERWAGSKEDKVFLKAHVFVYAQGQTTFANHINSIRRMNELSSDGWEIYDAKVGLLRRRK